MINQLQQLGLTRTKLAIIVGLGGLLVVVWGNALSGGGSSASRRTGAAEQAQAKPAKPRQAPALPRTAGSRTAASGAPQNFDPPPAIDLPPVDLPRVAAQDPFTPPRWAVDRDATARSAASGLTEQQATLEELRTTGVSAVVLSGGKKIAKIGSHHVQPGDTLSGYRVLDVTSTGVVLSEHPVDSNAP